MGVRRATRLLLALGLLVVLTGAGRPKGALVQMKFGVDMARRGAWKEAEFRFRRAAEMPPLDAEILNNLAVACENNGLYEDADLHYAAAVDVDPDNVRIRENYERFRRFLTKHVRDPEEGEPGAAGPTRLDGEPGS